MDALDEIANRKVAVVPVDASQPPIRASKLGGLFGFILLVLISLAIHTFAFEFVAPFTGFELSAVSRTLKEAWHPHAYLAIKVAELLAGWNQHFDSTDIAALTILTHGPYYFFLYVFYAISPGTCISYLAIDTLALAFPFWLLRPQAPAHNASAPASAVPNKYIINDFSVKVVTTLLPAAIYGVANYGSFELWLTPFLASRFSGLRTFEVAHNVLLPVLIAYAIPLGWSARVFLFSPSAAARPNIADVRQAGFNPETATLGETFAHNVWGFSLRTKILIKRTVLLCVLQGFYVWSQVFSTIKGAESSGAAGWAAMWVAATLTVGLAYQWVTNI